MNLLPAEIQKWFYQVLTEEISPGEFEQWLYANRELEKYIPAEDYLELIALNYKENSDKYALWRLLKKQIDLSDFETYKMLALLRQAQQKNDRLAEILAAFYHLYCRGYEFLQDLGLGMGLSIEDPVIDGSNTASWQSLSPDEQSKFLESLSPLLEECLSDLIMQLEKKKIVLTGRLDHNDNYIYKDFRSEAEKRSKYWIPVSNENAANPTFGKQRGGRR